jgi:hypothetical protein
MVVQVERRGDANRLHSALAGHSSRIQRLDGRWEVAVLLEARTAGTLEEMFVALGRWLAESNLSSCRVSFGELEFTLLQPTEDQTEDSVEALLERTVQLQIALDSRVAINLATGFVAANMDVSFDQAFALLRESARSRRIPLDDLAGRIIESRDARLPSGTS